MLGLDQFTPHEHDGRGPCGPGVEHCGRMWLFVFAIALHNLPEGMVYLVGSTSSPNFPVTVGATQSSLAGDSDALTVKMTAAGAVVYATYLGGTEFDDATATAIDAVGGVTALGYSTSGNFPVTGGAIQPALGGDLDVALFTLSATGSLTYATYLGGSGFDFGQGLAVNATGTTVVGGYTFSGDFPASPGAAQPTYAGGSSDGFVVSVSAAGSMNYATFVGGSGTDTDDSVSVDETGAAAATGATVSADFPTTTDRGAAHIRRRFLSSTMVMDGITAL